MKKITKLIGLGLALASVSPALAQHRRPDHRDNDRRGTERCALQDGRTTTRYNQNTTPYRPSTIDLARIFGLTNGCDGYVISRIEVVAKAITESRRQTPTIELLVNNTPEGPTQSVASPDRYNNRPLTYSFSTSRRTNEWGRPMRDLGLKVTGAVNIESITVVAEAPRRPTPPAPPRPTPPAPPRPTPPAPAPQPPTRSAYTTTRIGSQVVEIGAHEGYIASYPQWVDFPTPPCNAGPLRAIAMRAYGETVAVRQMKISFKDGTSVTVTEPVQLVDGRTVFLDIEAVDSRRGRRTSNEVTNIQMYANSSGGRGRVLVNGMLY